VDEEQYPTALSELVAGEYLNEVPNRPSDGNPFDGTNYTTDGTTYTLTYTLQNANDKGPGVVNGVLTLENKQ
jgi:hypothetical protein